MNAAEYRLPPKVWSALEYAIMVANCWADSGKIHIELLEREVSELTEKFEPVFERVGWKGEEVLCGYYVKPEFTGEMREQYRKSPTLAKVIAEKLAFNVAFGYPLPKGLRLLGFLIMSGKESFPRPKAVKPSQKHRNTLLVGLAKRISADASIPLASGVAVLSAANAKPISGATIAAAALHAFGVQVSAAQASKIVYEQGYIVSDEDLSGPIFIPNYVQPGRNLLADIDPHVALRRWDVSDLQSELESAVKWLKSPV